MKTSDILIVPPTPEYELLDSGEGEKLERWGAVIMSRPDPQALWQKRLPPEAWAKADAYFSRDSSGADWAFRTKLESKWPVAFGGLTFWIKPTAFKHTGLFPEQMPNWDWARKVIAQGIAEGRTGENTPEVLNLFGYTGGASLACAQAGAKVVHIDGSKAAVTWARENSELSGIADKPIRWIVEDARTFVDREIRRGRHYDGIIMDPPAFGHGPDSELWKIEEHFLDLIEDCKMLLKPQPLFFLVNGYSAGYSAIGYGNNLIPLKEQYGGEIETGELAIQEKASATEGASGMSREGRLLPAGIFARWSAK